MADMRLDRVLTKATTVLRNAGIEEPGREVRLLMEAAGIDRVAQIKAPDQAIPPSIMEAFLAMIDRRAAREPVSRILGQREFWSLSFLIDPFVLDPRPDSETLIEALLSLLPDRKKDYRILDFGTGSGCLLLALLHELPAAQGLGIDVSPAALSMASQNARRLTLDHRARFQLGDWGEGLHPFFDIILSNPPYIAEQEALPPEVARYDPALALFGGADGLAAYRALLPSLSRLLAPSGLAALEIGQGQREAVATLAQNHGLHLRQTRTDLSGIERCLILEKKLV